MAREPEAASVVMLMTEPTERIMSMFSEEETALEVPGVRVREPTKKTKRDTARKRAT